MLKHVTFGPKLRLLFVAGGTAIGAIGGMTKGANAEAYINKFVDAVNNTMDAKNKLNTKK